MRVTFDNDTSKNIYLIANNKNLNKKLLNNIKKNDIVILFNYSFWINHFKNHKNKILFMRHNNKLYGDWKGYADAEKYNFLNTYFINGYPRNINYKKFKYNKILVNDKIDLYKAGYPVNKSPTTGFWAYFILKKTYPNYNIKLIGFDYTNKKNWKWIGHAYDFETKYIKNIN